MQLSHFFQCQVAQPPAYTLFFATLCLRLVRLRHPAAAALPPPLHASSAALPQTKTTVAAPPPYPSSFDVQRLDPAAAAAVLRLHGGIFRQRWMLVLQRCSRPLFLQRMFQQHGCITSDRSGQTRVRVQRLPHIVPDMPSERPAHRVRHARILSSSYAWRLVCLPQCQR